MELTRKLLPSLTFVAAIPAVLGAPPSIVTGPSSSQSPYLLPVAPGVITMSVLTVGDSVNPKADGITPYRMVGIPDGLGAFENTTNDEEDHVRSEGEDNTGHTFTLLMNHELPGNGIVRDHGFNGAFVSKWTIDRNTLQVLHGEDLMKHAWRWDAGSSSYQSLTTAFSRFCSADLPAVSAFYNSSTQIGYNGHIYMNGEESGTEGRAVAHLINGNSYELPALGKMAWENVVANPATGDKTVVVGLDDGQGGQVYVYAGTKTSSTDPIAAAGLSNGNLFGIKVAGFPSENANTGIPCGTPFTAYDLGDVTSKSGGQIDAASVAAGVTTFQRPEDGTWDPENRNDFYFVTTASFTGKSRLWRLRFVSAANPALGGTIDMLLDGTEGQKMMDNITISRRGSIFAEEDVGNNAHIGRILRYDIGKRTLETIAQHDPARFTVGAINFLTQDEEASGIISMRDILGEGWYLTVVQAHYSTDTELVEGGQLVALYFPPKQEKKDK